MNDVILFALATALTLVALALAREVRLRRALERLVRLLLQRWRNRPQPYDETSPVNPDDASRPGDDPELRR